MAFGRLHEEAAGDGKLLALSDAAFRMWACGLIYCQKNLTDGFIPEHAIAAFGVRGFDGSDFYDKHIRTIEGTRIPVGVDRAVCDVLRRLTTSPASIADELCRAQLPGRAPVWERVAGGFKVHDYLDWNDSRTEILAARARSRARMRARRSGEQVGEQSGEHTREQSGEHVVDLPGELPPVHTGEPVVRGDLSPDLQNSGSGKGDGGRPGRHIGDGAAGIGGSPRAHLRHSWCDPTTFARCVPEPVHSKLANMLAPKFAGDRAKASAALLEWYPTVIATLAPDALLGDEFKFWQRQFDAAFVEAVAVGAKAAPAARSSVPGIAETAAKYL